MDTNEMKKIFSELYGEGEVRGFSSPGRVNLIGEHIDYCGGCVMPAALTMKTTLLARKRNDDIIRLKATDLDIMVETKISEMHNLKGKLKWGDYQIGVALELMNAGYDICGCDLLYDDTVPHGGGLSSSAAIEVSTALMFATFANEKAGITKEIDMIEMALLAQKAEHNFIDVKCGIMDQFASAMGKKDHAIYLNCATLEYEHIPLKLDGYKIVLTNTNVKHSLGSSKYNEKVEIIEREAEVVRNVFSLYVQGHSLKTIAERLNLLPISYAGDGREWDKNMVKRMLENKKYTGDKDYPVIIPSETAELALQCKDKRGGELSDEDKIKLDTYRLKTCCAICGAKMTRKHAGSGKKRRVYWQCTNNECDGSRHLFRERILDSIITEFLNELTDDLAMIEHTEDRDYEKDGCKI